MLTPAHQKKQKRSLLAAISRRSLARECQITAAMLTREKQRFITSHAVQSATLFDVRQKQSGYVEARREWKMREQRPIVLRSLDRVCLEPINWHKKKRGTSGFRKICKLPDNLLMWHRMAQELIVAQHRPRPHISDWKERGRDFQIREITSAITSPNQAIVVADVCRAFSSVNIDAIYELPYLPEALTRKAIDYRSLCFNRRQRGSCTRNYTLRACDHLEMDPAGLLEGSPASNVLFAVLMDDLPDHIDEDIQCFVYCDNIILIASDYARAQSAANALGRYFTAHRAGPFEVRSDIVSARNGFDHVGYSIKNQGDETTIKLSPRGWVKLMKRLHEKGETAEDTKKWLKASYSALPEREVDIWTAAIDDEHKFSSVVSH